MPVSFFFFPEGLVWFWIICFAEIGDAVFCYFIILLLKKAYTRMRPWGPDVPWASEMQQSAGNDYRASL